MDGTVEFEKEALQSRNCCGFAYVSRPCYNAGRDNHGSGGKRNQPPAVEGNRGAPGFGSRLRIREGDKSQPNHIGSSQPSNGVKINNWNNGV